MQNRTKLVLIIVLTFIVGVVLGFGAEFVYQKNQKNQLADNVVIKPIREHDSSYKFIDPLLAYIIPQADKETQLNLLKSKISSVINKQKADGLIKDASVFFYDMNRGRWIGVNEGAQYKPASMLKVVIMVSYFKKTETEKDLLKKELIYDQRIDKVVKSDDFFSNSVLQINKGYAIEDLINKMIIDSDNGAELLLLDNIDPTSLSALYNALNIPTPESSKGDFVISPRAYSLFFRILYNATYLDKATSEKALKILSQTTFNDGLVAGLPEGVIVSHKFGQVVLHENSKINELELHDCGIIYYPSYPYFLCVMTKGKDNDKLKSFIKNISLTVYEEYQNLK